MGNKYETLAHNKPGKSIEPYIVEPAFEEKAIFQHEGEELLNVLEGIHEFTYDGNKYIMHEGDCAYFDSGVPHTGKSLGSGAGENPGSDVSHEKVGPIVS